VGLEKAIEELCRKSAEAANAGAQILILSDRGSDKTLVPIPSLLATAAVHHHLIREGLRTKCGIVVESGEPREVMHFALLSGYGASAWNPYVAFESIKQMIRDQILKNVS